MVMLLDLQQNLRNLLKKDNLVKYALAIVFGYWMITTIYNCLPGAMVVTKGYAGLTIASGFFRFLIALILLGCIVLFVLSIIKKDKKFLQIAFCAFAGSLLFFFLVWVLRIAAYAKWDADWTDYFALFQDYLFTPIGLVFAVLAYLMEKRAVATEVASPEVNIEEVPAQNVDIVKEAAATEEPVESTTEKTEVAEESTKEKDVE